MSTKTHGGDKRGGFVLLGDVAGAVDLPGGLATGRDRSPWFSTKVCYFEELPTVKREHS